MKIWAGLLGVAGLFVIFPSEASAADWVYVTGDDQAKFYVDQSSIRSTGPVRRYWTRKNYDNDREGWKQAKTLYENNCTTGQYRILSMTVLFVDGTSKTQKGDEWFYIAPETHAESLQNFVCER